MDQPIFFERVSMDRALDLSQLAGDDGRFFSNYYGKIPFLRRGAVEKPKEVLSVQRLDAILREQVVQASYITVVKNSRPLHSGAYSASVRIDGQHFADRVVPEKMARYIDGGATAIWRQVHLFCDSMRKSREIMAEKLGARSDTYAFVTPPGVHGLSTHDDPDDVFAVQLEGCKRWKIWRPQGNPRLPGKIYDLAEVENLGEPVMDVTLEPGDFLYIPRHAPHATLAGAATSLHVTVAVRHDMWSQIISSIAERVMGEDPRFSELPLFSVGAQNWSAGLRARLHELAASLEAVDVGKEIQRIIDDGKQAAPISGW
ncbi:JmjC domain-containing protein [Streptomyces sp. NPDC060027]|uniref:JmjC domain-containing protein n=1 Tax=Streptomyces sp. NPDC060027 TaxID=3347040 RepID=UPI0036A35B1F